MNANKLILLDFDFFYDVADGVTRVIAVLDMRQNPKSIRQALEKRKSQQGGVPE